MEKSIYIILLALYGVVMLLMCYIDIFLKKEKPKNKVHFYVARDKNGVLWLYLSKPAKIANTFLFGSHGETLSSSKYFSKYGLNARDYANLKWEDSPVEVFLNLED